MLDRMKGPILKSRDEIAVMDRANRVVLEILEIMRSMAKPGATTAQLNAVAEEELAKRGAKSPFKGYAPMGLPPMSSPLFRLATRLTRPMASTSNTAVASG